MAGELELGGLLLPVDAESFDVLPILREPLWLVARHGSRWDAALQVRLADLAAEPFVFYGESLALNDIVMRACRDVGFTPTIVARSGHWDFMAALVQAGLGIALLPALYCRRLDAAQFTCRPVSAPEIPWAVAIGWRRNGYLSHAARAWLDVARETLPGRAGNDFGHTRSVGPGDGGHTG
jgi:DNA-binding transcriptional LysR family regulator